MRYNNTYANNFSAFAAMTKLDEILWYFRMGEAKEMLVRGTDGYANANSQRNALATAITRNRCDSTVKAVTRKGEVYLVKTI